MTVAYLTKVKDKLLFTGTKMEAYIPDKLFKKNLNEYQGQNINLIGIFNYRIGDAKGNISNSSKLYTVKFPSKFVTKPNSYVTKEMELIPGMGSEKYHVLTYYKNDEVMVNTNIVKSIDNVKIFLDLLLSGNLPSTINYEDILKIMIKCAEINGETCGVTSLIYSVVCSELCRYRKDQSIPFRKIIGKDKAGQLDYYLSNARSVCANSSTFSALTFEDIDTMLVYAINKKRYNKAENDSPLESIINI